MATTFIPGALQWLGIAKETTYGTPAAAPTIWVPVDTPTWKPVPQQLKDTALRGAMATVYQQVQGIRHDEITYKTYLYNDSLFSHLLGAVGGPDVVSGTTSAPTTLSAAAAAGATTISTVASIAATTVIQIDTGGLSEIATVSSVTGTGPYTLTLATATKNAHASGATVATAAQPFTHSSSLYNVTSATANAQPPSWTVFLYQGDGKVVQMPGAIISDAKVTIKADNSLPTLDITWMGMPSAFITAPVNTPTTLQPDPAYTASVTIGGSANTQYTDVTLDLKRTANEVPVLNGTQSPLAIGAFNFQVTGTINGVYQGTADVNLVDLIANTQPALVVSLFGAGDSTHPITFQMSKVVFDTVAPTGSPTSWMPISGNFEALANATDALDGKFSPILVKLANSSSTSF